MTRGLCLVLIAMGSAWSTVVGTVADAQPISAPQASPVITLPNQPPTPGATGDWFGYRSKLARNGLTVAAAVYYDYSKNFRGGISTSDDASRELFDLDITFATDPLLHWHGGTFFFNILDHEGTNGTEALVGDAQGFDNQDGARSTQIYQLYYQQMFAEDKLRLKVGRIDSTTDFAYTTNGVSFLGSSFGFSPAITSFPTYPDPAPGAALFWTPNEHFYATGGVADASRSDRDGILSGQPYAIRPTSDGIFLISELGAKWTLAGNKLAGRLGIGGYHHTGMFRRFDETNQHGASGMFLVFDQTLWQPLPLNADSGISGRSIGIFAQYGLADAEISAIDQHIGSGIQWTGPIPTAARATDVFGIGPSVVHFSHQARLARDFELAIETFYKLQVTPWLNIQPDLQYILIPGGERGRDALVGTIRFELDF